MDALEGATRDDCGVSTAQDHAPRPPKAFISYAHTSAGWTEEVTERWMADVLSLAMALSAMGIDVELDQFHFEELGVDWNRFGTMAVQDSDFVLIAVSPSYRERFEGTNDPSVGAGAVREADAILGILNHDQEEYRHKVVVLVLPEAGESDVPTQLSGHQRFTIAEVTDDGVESLFRLLSRQPATPKPPVGPLREMPPRSSSESMNAAAEELAHLRRASNRLEAALRTVDPLELEKARRGNRALPGERAAAQLDAEHQRVVQRISVLEGASELPATSTEQPAVDAKLVLEAIRAADRSSPGADITYFDVAARLRCPPNDPDFQRCLARAAATGLIEEVASVDQLPGPIVFRLAA